MEVKKFSMEKRPKICIKVTILVCTTISQNVNTSKGIFRSKVLKVKR